MKRIFELLKNVEHEILSGTDVEIENMVIDSRLAVEGSLFICINGLNVDGHEYIQLAVDKGARAVVIEHEADYPEGITVIKVADTRKALDEIAGSFYDYPAKDLRMIGVTGTNGKTSTTYFLEQILMQYGESVGVIGTIEQRVNQKKIDVEITTSTTPDTIELQKILSIMREEQAKNVVMEVSSHALELNKLNSVKFEVAIFTNLTQDHLDFHKTMLKYIQAKAKLFKMCKYAVLNADSKGTEYILGNSACQFITYSIENPSDLRAKDISYTPSGIEFSIEINENTERFFIGIPGKFSLYNALGVIAAAIVMQVPVDTIRKGLEQIKGVPGRIERIESNKDFNVFVDYAHSPDGLKNIIQAVRDFTKGRVIIIFGCGGDRDKLKRPVMGGVCAELADHVIITSDNPRSENPQDIINEILSGINENCKYETFVDRKKAIYHGIEIAEAGDSVIIAGKGHEDYQILANETIHFDDREVAKLALEEIV